MSAFLRKYGQGTGSDVFIPLLRRGIVDFAVGADYTPSAGDVKLSLNGAAAVNIGTLPVAVAMGNTAMWQFVFTNAELQAATIAVTLSDSATKAVEDQMFLIETYGHASALHAFDLDTAGVTQVWDATMANHLTAGTTGATLQGAGSAGDPWTTAIPGAYGAGTAGQILGTTLDATVSSRSVYAGGAVASVTAAVTVGTNNDKTNYSLSAAGITAHLGGTHPGPDDGGQYWEAPGR